MKPIFIPMAIFLIVSIPFFNNIYDLSRCDFEEPYRCEVIHTVGLVMPPLSYITMWFDSDEDET